jgi:hypothetical protein
MTKEFECEESLDISKTNIYPNSTVKISKVQYSIFELKNNYKDWKISEDKVNTDFRDLHDMYLIIDNKIELILTSGFEYLFDNSKDLIYILKVKK